MNLNQFEISQRSRNGLALAGISTLGELVHADAQRMSHKTKMGITSFRELLWVCVQMGFKPKWLNLLSKASTHAECVRDPTPDLVLLSGPYHLPKERIMLELAIAQLAPIQAEVFADGNDYYIYRTRVGYKESPEDLEDTK